MYPPLITGPQPAFNNPPIEPQYYQPSLFFISALSLGITTLITMSANHNYVIGQEVRLLIPNGYGSRQLNEKTGFVLSIPTLNQVILDINSLMVDPFVNANLPTKSQIIAIGDKNSGNINANGRFNLNINIPGAFINISPN